MLRFTCSTTRDDNPLNTGSSLTTSSFPIAPGIVKPPSSLSLAKYFERHGGDPRRWLQEWMRIKKIESGDRIYHELKVLIDIFYYSGVFDQLNIGALVGIECAALRIQLIIEAYQNPAKPNWESAKFFSGSTSIEDGVQSELKGFVTKKAKEEAEVWHARHRARELRGKDPANDAYQAVGDGVMPAAGGGRGRGRG